MVNILALLADLAGAVVGTRAPGGVVRDERGNLVGPTPDPRTRTVRLALASVAALGCVLLLTLLAALVWLR